MPQCECCGQTDLHSTIIEHGQLEQFYQSKGNGFMQEWHKNQRLKLEALNASMTIEQRIAWKPSDEKF